VAATSVELKKLARREAKSLQISALHSASPLWARAPRRDEQGIAYADFMLLIPGLKQQSAAGKQACLIEVQQCLKPFDDIVVFVDLNIKLSLLWVSHKPQPGIAATLVQAIQQALPEARVIAADFNTRPEPEPERQRSWLSLFGLSLKTTLKRLR
jgi:hypothetical protein